jgi:hypothetical protein
MQILEFIPQKEGRAGFVVARSKGHAYEAVISDGRLVSTKIQDVEDPRIWWCTSFVKKRFPRKRILAALHQAA